MPFLDIQIPQKVRDLYEEDRAEFKRQLELHLTGCSEELAPLADPLRSDLQRGTIDWVSVDDVSVDDDGGGTITLHWDEGVYMGCRDMNKTIEGEEGFGFSYLSESGVVRFKIPDFVDRYPDEEL